VVMIALKNLEMVLLSR